MGFLFLDPQSELTENRVSGDTSFQYDFHAQLKRATGGRFDKNRDCVTIDQIRLEGVEIFVRILDQVGLVGFFNASLKREQILSVLRSELEDLAELEDTNAWKPVLSPEQLETFQVVQNDVETPFFDWMCSVLSTCYAGSNADKKREEFKKRIKDKKSYFFKVWRRASELFESDKSCVSLRAVINDVLHEGKVKIIDLNPARLDMGDEIRNEVMLLIFKRISEVAQTAYKSKGEKKTNAMIVLDEAGLFIPAHTDNDRVRRIATDLADKAKMLRKLSVGMLFFTQRISSISSEIFAQLHFRIYGAGLAVGLAGGG